MLINKKKITNHLVDYAVTPDHRGKITENEKTDLNIDVARELIKLWNVKVTVILILVGAPR